MNILITSFSLLLILALGSSLFWKEAISSSFSFRAVKGVYEAARTARNSLEKKQFAHFKNANVEPNNDKGKQKKKGLKTSIFYSHRLENPPIEQGRFGIMSIRELEQQPILKPILQKFLFELYGHTEWFDQKILQKIIDKFASSSGDFDKQSFINQLNDAEYKVWYLMSKGTQNYDLVAKKGYPPLEDYIDFKPRSIKHTCHFPFASFPLIKAMFGEEIAREILNIEKKKWNEDHRRRFCLKKELLVLAQTRRQSAELTKLIESYCYFNQSIGKRSFVQGEEKNSGIVIRREVP
jgi:hypothetical protein